jgi:hypothetical protein
MNVSGSPPPRSWKEIRSALADYAGIIAFVFWAFAGLSWFTGIIPAWFALVVVGFAAALTIIGIAGHIFVSGGQPLTSLGSLLPNPELSSQRKKFRPQSNLTFVGIEYVDLYVDENDVYWEIRRGKPRQVQPSYSVVLRFSNEPVAGQAGQPIRGLRAKLTFRDAETGQEFPAIDRALWVQEKYNAITLEVGDSRLLLIGFGLPRSHQNPPFVLVVSNNYYEGRTDGAHLVRQLVSSRIEVDVRLVAGNGGYVFYEGAFELRTTPRLVLNARTTK